MRAATAHAAVSAAHMERSMTALASRAPLESGKNEELIRIDLSDLILPKVNDLHVDGLKSSWLSRIFGKK